MTKFIFSLLNFFLVFGMLSAEAGIPQDTSTVVISRDSSTALEPDSVSVVGDAYDSLYLPVQDSLVSLNESARRVSEKQLERYKKNPEYAYANDSEYWRKEPPHEPGLLFRILNSPVTFWIFISVIALLILYGMYQLAVENNFTLLIRTGRKKTENTDPGLTRDKINFDEVIRINQADGNYRVAIRFLYLRLIQVLHEKSGIAFSDSSTNAEITRAIGSNPEASTFRWLATAYEYVYYGEFVPNQETYFLLKNKFDGLQKIFSD